jgi:nucleoside phosphorylase
MCFGVDRQRQSLGDVIVSSALVAYDRRVVISQHMLPRYRYHKVARFPAKRSLTDLFVRTAKNTKGIRVHVGAVLTGGAHISCAAYRDHLVSALTEVAADRIEGGEMEGSGLLGLSPADDPQWCVVKAVCDFADEQRNDDAPAMRAEVCLQAASFVLKAIQQEALPSSGA